MRFFLDEDTDARIARFLAKEGHDAWTTQEAGRAGQEIPDDDQAVYADDKHAVLVTHDEGLMQRQRQRMICPVVWLGCPHPDEDTGNTRFLIRLFDQIRRKAWPPQTAANKTSRVNLR